MHLLDILHRGLARGFALSGLLNKVISSLYLIKDDLSPAPPLRLCIVISLRDSTRLHLLAANCVGDEVLSNYRQS